MKIKADMEKRIAANKQREENMNIEITENDEAKVYVITIKKIKEE